MQILKGNHSGRMQHAGARGSSGLCPPPATEQRASTLRAGLKQASERPGREGPPKFCLPGCLAPAWLRPYIIQGLLEPPGLTPPGSRVPFPAWEAATVTCGSDQPFSLSCWGPGVHSRSRQWGTQTSDERELVFFTIGRTTIVNTGRGTSLV